ncbi:MAG: hypothetical protein AAGK23_01580 [Pseudomonadota bacterium]
MKHILMAGLAGLAITACGGAEETIASAPETETVAEEVIETAAAPTQSPMEVALAGDWRSDDNKARDAHRHPAETLAFFEVDADETVIEIWPGGGWYTEVIAPYLASGGGTYIAAGNGRADRDAAFAERFSDTTKFGTVNQTTINAESGALADAGTVDTVLSFRNVHNWMGGSYEAKVFEDVFASLKPGGVFGLVEHRLPSSADQDPKARTGYVHQDYVIQLAEAAGFEFAASSEINANPKDTADHPFGVWTLPPTSFAGNENRPAPEGFDAEAYKAIGESDRFTLKFVKPGA